MSDKNKPGHDEKPAGENPPGKYHYNPVNMSGKDAGIVEEVEEKVESQGDETETDADSDKKWRKENGRPTGR